MNKSSLYTNILDQIPANRRLVEELYSHGKISLEAKKYALNFLYPSHKWKIWISRFLITIGSALLLCGIIYFFAFNWAKITPAIKLTSIQLSMIGCLIGTYYFSLKCISGQMFLLAASVLIGVFMAVFGQIYQTGADAYQLFMMWSIFTLGWTIISNFTTQWILWLVITNTFFVLWWKQSAFPSREMEFMIFFYTTLLNGSALILCEYFASYKNYIWLQQKWSRIILIIAVLISMSVPILAWIVEPEKVTISIILSATFGLIGHGVAYMIYCHKLKDMWSLAAIVLSGCIMIEVWGFKMISKSFGQFDASMFLIMGLMTLGVFTGAIAYLRKVASGMESNNV